MKFTLAFSSPSYTRYDIYNEETWFGEIQLVPNQDPVIVFFYPAQVRLSFINKLTNFIASHAPI